MISICQARMRRSIYIHIYLGASFGSLGRSRFTLNRGKCEFMAHSVAYLGHVTDAQGLHPDPDKVRAINDAPQPRSVSDLKSYLGLLAYFSKFLADLVTLNSLPSIYSMPSYSVTHHGVGPLRKRKHISSC